MDFPHDSVTQNSPYTVDRRLSGDTSVSEVFGFPIVANQFSTLQASQPAETQCQEQEDVGLVDPRTTRHLRNAAQRTDDRGSQADVGSSVTVSAYRNTQGILYSGTCVDPVVPGISSPFFVQHSFSASPSEVLNLQYVGHVHYSLGTGASDDASLYDENVKDVACTIKSCNKRISCAGPDWSAGRPGHTPIRRILACGKHIEDRCAGQDWSAGRPDLTPFGASSAACPSSQTACIGPYGTAFLQQHHTGCNTREETSLTSSVLGLPRHKEQSTTQPRAASSGRHAAYDRASPATVVLQPRRPPYFCGGIDDDVHVWTAIVDHWLSAIQGEPSVQLTYIVSLLRGAAYEWYLHYETRTGCPGDWTTLRRAMLERFGTSIRAEKARAGLYRLKQDNMTALQYADAFELFLAQLGGYEESDYLVHFIFGLRPEIMRGVYVQQPASLPVAKNMAEKLELTHLMTSDQQKHTKKQKTSKAQHRGTQERRSGGRYQWKTCSTVQRQRKIRETQHPGCRSTHPGALEASCPERHGPAAVWRSLLKDLPQGDRAGRMRRQGSVVTVSLEALTRSRNDLPVGTTVAGMSMHPPSGRAKAPRVYLRNRLLRRDRERKTRASVRERQMVTQLLETLVSPSRGDTESGEGVTTSKLQGRQSTRLKKAITGEEEGSTVPQEPQTQLSAVSLEYQPPIPRSEEDGILLIVPARIFGREIHALIDSGATRNFISPAGVTQCGLTVQSHNTFLELGDGKKVLSRGRAVDVPVVTSSFMMQTNLTVTNLLHGVDLVLGMTWLKVAGPLIRWSTGQMYIPDSVSSF